VDELKPKPRTRKKKAMRSTVTKPVTLAPVQKAPPPSEKVEVRSWKGMPLYQCRLCPFNSLSERTFWEHWMNRHQPPKATGAGLVGPDGKPLTKEE